VAEKRDSWFKKLTPDSRPSPATTPEPKRQVVDTRVLEEWYSAAFRQRIDELRERLSAEIAESLLSQFDSQLKCRNGNVNYVWESSADSLKHEIASLQKRYQAKDGLDEIARAEKEIAALDSELEKSITDDSVPLSRLLQLRAAQTDLKSYLRGLKFHFAKSISAAAHR
jgi:hypothetical protein